MKLKKLCYAISVVLAACLSHNASAAQNTSWIGTGGNDLWSNPANWNSGVPSNAPGTSAFDSFVAGHATTTITNLEVENLGTLSTNVDTYVTNGSTITTNLAAYGTLYGPEWSQILNVYGTLNVNWAIAPVGTDPANPSTINVYTNGQINVLNLGLGDNWWFYVAPYVTLNMYGGARVTCDTLWWGGHVNLYDNSVITVNQSFFDRGVTTFGVISDATRQLDLLGGTMIIAGNANVAAVDYATFMTNYVARGILLVYGRQYDTNNVSITLSNTLNTVYYYTTNGSVITTNAVFGTNVIIKALNPLGTLQSIYLVNPRTNMMVSTYQNPVGKGNYQNYQDVPLSVLDAAQMGGNTLNYVSSDTNVIVVTASGHVTAIKAGSANVSAKLGSFTSTNSVTINVIPYTNSLIHRYSFSETGGSTTADSVGGSAWDGLLDSGATLGGGWVTLDPNNFGAILLPAGIVTNMDAVSVEAWVSNGTPAGWAQLFAFGNQDGSGNGMNYIAFQPFTGIATNPTAAILFGTGDPGNANSQNAVAALTTTGLQGTNIVTITNPLPTMLHLACVFHPYAGTVAFYTNGVLCASNSNVSNPLGATLNTDGDPLNLIGESLYSVDPFWSGAINEFRIYNGPLSAAQIMADYRLGPNQLIGTNKSVTVSCVPAPPASNGKYRVNISWPTNSALVDLMTSRALVGANWTPLNVTNLVVTNGTFRMTLLATNSPQFYRLQQY
jgi:Concanavalin A-like lectin/glucanases superfamily